VSVGAVEVVFVAGSPANLYCISQAPKEIDVGRSILIRHDHKESFLSELVCLQLVVDALDSCASSKEE